MAESRKLYNIKSEETEEIKTSEEVIATIAGLAAQEVDGVNSLAGSIRNKRGSKNPTQGISLEILDGEVKVDTVLNINYGYSIPDISFKVQDRIKSTIETMTGLKVAVVNVRIASVIME